MSIIGPKDSPRRYKYIQRGFWRSGLPATLTCCVTFGWITSVLVAARLHSKGFALEDPGCPFQLPHLATHWAQRWSLPLITCTLLHRSVNALLFLHLTWKTPSCFLDSASSLLTLDPFFGSFPASCPFLSLAMLCGMWDLSSLTRAEPVPPAVEAQSLNHWTTREVLLSLSAFPPRPTFTHEHISSCWHPDLLFGLLSQQLWASFPDFQVGSFCGGVWDVSRVLLPGPQAQNKQQMALLCIGAKKGEKIWLPAPLSWAECKHLLRQNCWRS